MNRQIRKSFLFAWLILGAPILGGLVAGGIGTCAGLLLQWLLELPDRSFWLIGVVFGMMGLFIGIFHGWKAASLLFQYSRNSKNG